MNKQFLKYRDFLSLNESKATAKRRFLDNGKIDQKTFTQLAAIDPSSSFKYVEKLIEFYLEGISIETLKKEIKIFDELSSRNLLKNKDIQQLNYQEFKQEISTGKTKSNSRKEQKQKEAGVQVLLDNEFFRIVVPDTEEASCKYGQGTKWCTSGKEDNQFRNYRYRDEVTLYYIEDKSKSNEDPLYKIAVAIYPDRKKEVFDSLDKKIYFSNLPKELFKYFPREEFKPRDLSVDLDPIDKYGLDRSKVTENEDGSIDYDGNVDLSEAKLTELPIKFKNVKGDFNCRKNHLKSLEGSPESVGGYFDCYDNKLENLKGAPKSVDGWFDCSSNELKSLEDAPESVGGNFDCTWNQLKSLEGSPESVGGYFNCTFNQLESLEGAPKSVDGGYFNCSDNELESLEGAPESVGGIFYCYSNELKSLKGAPKYVGSGFNCQNNPDLKSLDGIGEVKGKIYSDIK